MNQDEKYEIETARDYVVSKSNVLVQKNRYNLSVQEQKTIAFICSMIKPVEVLDKINSVPYQLEYEFDIRKYCQICNIDYNNGKNYADIKSILKGLSDKSMWVTFDEKPDEEVLCRWLAKVRTNKRSGIAHIKLDEDLVPYLFDLKNRFTSYGLRNILCMKSQYSIRLYELLKSYKIQVKKTFTIEEFKKLLMIEDIKSYNRFPDLRRYVLEPAMKEINEYTDIDVSYREILKGRKVIKLEFHIKDKEQLFAYAAYRKNCNILNLDVDE